MQNIQSKSTHDLVTKAKETINTVGYATSTEKLFKRVWKQLEKYSDNKGITDYSVELGNQFLENHYQVTGYKGQTRVKQQYLRAVQLLNELMLHGYMQPRRSTRGYEFPECYSESFNRFIAHRKSLGIVKTSIQITKLYLERFGLYLTSVDIDSLDDITTTTIHGFIRSLVAYGKPTANCTMRIIRQFMKWAFDEGIITKDISHDIPSIHYNRYPKIPSAYTKKEVEQILSVIDRSNPKGKRDYVAILLASKLGLRSSDIRSLTFKDILWEDNKIEKYQQKTGNHLSLPLLEDVGMALIDYIKNGRPETDAKTIIVKHVPPYDKVSSSCIYGMVNRYMQAAKIPAPPHKKRGPHSLRHSLASSLLEADTPLPVISEILGHVDTDTTTIYLTIDIQRLRECALDVTDYQPAEV
jgi:integrase